jgi:arginine exporter protein ArgO
MNGLPAGLTPFDPLALLLMALLNPAVIAVAILMGRQADQSQKILIAGFTAACAGAALVWLAIWFHVLPARANGREVGLFVLQIICGMGWAALGYYRLRGRP